MAAPGSWPSEITWEIQDADGAVVMSGNADSTDVQILEMSFGETYTLVMNDSWGDGWNGGSISVNGTTYTVEGGAQATASIACIDPNVTAVTFTVNTANIEEIGPNGIYLGGGVFNSADAHAMSDDDGDGTWEVTVEVADGTAGNYAFFNSPSNSSDWGTKENLEDKSVLILQTTLIES